MDEDNDGRFPDDSLVEVRYPRNRQEQVGDRSDWPWLPGLILGQCGPDEWHVESSSAVIFRELYAEEFLRGLGRDAFTRRLAYFLGEVNALHPFRDGNGRTQRAFFGQLARDAGYTLAWQHLDAARNVAASAATMRGDPEPMREMLDTLVREHT